MSHGSGFPCAQARDDLFDQCCIRGDSNKLVRPMEVHVFGHVQVTVSSNRRDAGWASRVIIGFYAVGLLCLTTGCLSPLALHRAVMSYDETVNQVESEELVLNIARIHRRHPIHFTAVSSVAATFNFRVSAGATPPLGAIESGRGLAPVFGGQASENPTITLLPIQGEEFNEHVLTSLTEGKFVRLLQQGTDLGILLRLLGAEFRFDEEGRRMVLWNRPDRRSEYEEFRRRVLHLSGLYEAHQLYVEPLVIEHRVSVPRGTSVQAEAVMKALDQGYRWEEQAQAGALSKRMSGRTVLTNYDPAELTAAQRQQLFLDTNTLPNDEVFIDIRPGHPGGEYPMRGVLQLRGFLGMLNFVARGITEHPEFHVEPDARSRPVRQNPARTLEIVVGTGTPARSAVSVDYEHATYAVLEPDGQLGSWNLETFRLLRQVFELAIDPSDFSRPVPSITIGR